jgi:hypothetical protein
MGSVTRWGGMRLARRLARSVPFLGAAIALVTVGAAIRRKGLFGGTADAALDAMPFVGAAKTAVEVVRGRDLIPDRRRTGLSPVKISSDPNVQSGPTVEGEGRI